MLEKDLQNLGLSEKEAKVYITSLQLGKSSVQNISKKAGVNRATTYVIIESLIKKGLISSSHEDKKQFFFAESPEKLNILFRDQELEIRKKQEYLEKILPDLKTLNTATNGKPIVRFFEGKEGLRAMSEEFYLTKHHGEARNIYSYDLLTSIFSDSEIKEMRARRQNMGVKIKTILNDEQKRLVTDANKVILPSKKYPITTDIAFFENKVRIATQKGDLVGLIIENKEICDTLKLIFDLAWEQAKTIQK